jgi:hypothetical protein
LSITTMGQLQIVAHKFKRQLSYKPPASVN